jgi:CRP/FNR family transcriptional regulator
MDAIVRVKETVKPQDLRRFDLFVGLDEKELAEIARFCNRRIFERNAIISTIGVAATDIYLLEGKNDAIQIELPIDDYPTRIITHTLSKGETFGWSALVPPQLRTALIRCVEETEVIIVSGTDLIKLFQKNNHIGYVVMKNLSAVISSRLTCTTIALRHKIRNLIRK